MEFVNEFLVPLDADTAFDVLTDVERVAPCLPGARLDSVEDGEYVGSVTVKLGPVQVTYRGRARLSDVDEAGRTATLVASGKEARGSGTARAQVTMEVKENGAESSVVVNTNLNITGRPAQLGRGVMADVGARIIDAFAECLRTDLLSANAAAPVRTATATTVADPGRPVQASEVRAVSAAPLDLVEFGGGAVWRRLLPVVVAVTATIVLWRWRRR